MRPEAHGGDLRAMAIISGCDAVQLLDFSVNVRPEGPPDFLLNAMRHSITRLAAYPSPHADEACAAAAQRHTVPVTHFVFGNGSNELIHALARVLKKKSVPAAYIVEPAFSEYALACRLAGVEVRRIRGGISAADGVGTAQPGLHSIGEQLVQAPAGAAVFFANPGNPSGLFYPVAHCLPLLQMRSDLLWVVDEAFVEYVGPDDTASLVPHTLANVIVLRSLTKFYAVPGVRLGYMVAAPHLAETVRAEMPVWNVNTFAIAAAVAALEDTSVFAAQTRAQNAARRADLMGRLSALPDVEVFASAANYVLFRCHGAQSGLGDTLLRNFGIAVRDCANYYGLEDGTWFRAAVRLPQEHERLATALRHCLSR